VTDSSADFPFGAAIDLAELARDPYPTYAKLRELEPVSFVPALNMYLVTRYDDVTAILKDTTHFVVGTEHSTVFDTFGEHMMTVEGERHDHYKRAHQPFFLPATIRDNLEGRIREHADALIDEFVAKGEVELRSAFSSRLPVLTMLSMFGLKQEEESRLREWYDSFEKALCNFTWDEAIRTTAKENVARFMALIQRYLDELRSSNERPDTSTLLGALLNGPDEERLTDEAICRNALIIFFGGISTVDALILNTLFALSSQPETLDRVRHDLSLIPAAINETVRWLGPVQSATRHVVRQTNVRGVTLKPGDTVNNMLAAANRDPAMFENPTVFDIDRGDVQRQVGFAVGPHHCLGSRLARAEARIALQRLFERLPDFQLDLDRVDGPHGYEFRQPTAAVAIWDAI
jgi:cytochrome P450